VLKDFVAVLSKYSGDAEKGESKLLGHNI